MPKPAGFFDGDERLRRLSDSGNQLETDAEAVDFEIVLSDLIGALNDGDGTRGGRPPYDPVLLFKVLSI